MATRSSSGGSSPYRGGGGWIRSDIYCDSVTDIRERARNEVDGRDMKGKSERKAHNEA